MKKRMLMTALVLVCVLVLSACGCKHETWNDADCVTPKTCAECGETEGEALGHTWLDASCETPKTCEVCAVTEGEALGHSWTDADCETPKTCATCGQTEGEALGHDWQDATTELPKTCAVCKLTEGERIVTDPRFTTAATADIQGTWILSFPMTGELMGLEGFDADIDCNYIFVLGNDGTTELSVAVADEEAFKSAMKEYLVEELYAEFAAAGLNKTQADAAMVEAYGVDTEQYADIIMNTMDMNAIFEAMCVSAVYYVADNQLYMGYSWELEMEPTEFTLEGDTLTLYDDVAGTGAEESVFTRVTE